MVDRKRIELFPKACKAPVLPLSLTAHLKILHQYIVFVKSKNKNWMTTTCEYTRISLLCSIYHMSNSFNFSLLYLLMVACYNSNTLTVKLVGDDGIEPPQADSKSAALPLCKSPVKLERVVRIELTLPVWKTGALPLSYTRKWRKEKDLNLRGF